MSDQNVLLWDIHMTRDWPRYYFVTDEGHVPMPVPPIRVVATAEFTNEAAARRFERRVLEILEDLTHGTGGAH